MLSILVRHFRLIVWMAFGSGVVVGGILLLMPREYSAGASFVPQDATAVPGGLTQLAAQFGIGTPRGQTTSPQFYADLLQSRQILRDVIAGPYDVTGATAFKGTLFDYFKIPPMDGDRATMLALKKMASIMSVSVNRVTGVVTFEVQTRNPDLSREMARRLVALVSEFNLKRRQSQAGQERQFVEARLAQAKDELRAAEAELEQFYTQNRSFRESPTLSAQEARLQRVVSLRQQVFTSLSQSYESARIEEVRNTPVITVIAPPEGFVDRMPRGTILKTAAAVVAGGILGLGLAMTLEFLRRSREAVTPEFSEFMTSWRATFRRASLE